MGQTANKQYSSESDMWRKRVIAVICSYNAKTGVHPDNPVLYAKSMACRTLGYSQELVNEMKPSILFNKIKNKDLRSIYNTYIKLQNMVVGATKVAAEHATNSIMN